jgi:hypothetical protein
MHAGFLPANGLDLRPVQTGSSAIHLDAKRPTAASPDLAQSGNVGASHRPAKLL